MTKQALSSHNITAREEIKALIQLSMHYNNICDCYPTENPGMHSFFKMRDERIEALLGEKGSSIFFDHLIGNDEPKEAYKFAVNNLKFQREGADCYKYIRD
tara:strand:- start:182 stop:484 length:303 start_codon:yes stop_codon:yes gene_type:complete